MQCNLFFFYSKEINFGFLFRNLKNIPEPYRVVTTNIDIHSILKKKGKNSIMLNHMIPDEGQLAEEIYENSKKILEEYRDIFRDITFRNIEILRGFEYHILLQLILIGQAKKILEDKQNTVFIFERFSPAYFAIMSLSRDIGYDNDVEIGFIHGNKIEYVKPYLKNDSSDYTDKFSRLSTIHFVRRSLGNNISISKLNSFLKFSSQIFFYSLRKFFYESFYPKKLDSIRPILNRIDKKMQKTYRKDTKCVLFITASRLDLFLRPLLPVFEKFNLEEIPPEHKPNLALAISLDISDT